MHLSEPVEAGALSTCRAAEPTIAAMRSVPTALASLGVAPPPHGNGNTHPFNSDDLAMLLGVLGSILLMGIVTVVVLVVVVRRSRRTTGAQNPVVVARLPGAKDAFRK